MKHPQSHLRVALIAALAAVSVVVGLLVPIPHWHRAVGAVGDLVHAPLFCGITLGILYLLQRIRPIEGSGRKLRFRLFWTGSVVLVLAVASEIAQSRFGRSPTLHDAASNGLGIIAALAFYWAFRIRRAGSGRRILPGALAMLGVGCIFVAWTYPVRVLIDVAKVYVEFPTLSAFETAVELERWHFRDCQMRLTERDVTDGQYALEMVCQPTRYPGATLIELKNDWSQLQTLELDVTVDASYPAEQLDVMIKIFDEFHQGHSDTFRRTYSLSPGTTTRLTMSRADIVSGPDDRPLVLSTIQFVDVLLVQPVSEAVVRIDSMRLTLEKF